MLEKSSPAILDGYLYQPRGLTPEARLVVAMIEDAYLNVKYRCDYYTDSKDFLLDKNEALSSWLEYLRVDEDLIRRLARNMVLGR